MILSCCSFLWPPFSLPVEAQFQGRVPLLCIASPSAIPPLHAVSLSHHCPLFSTSFPPLADCSCCLLPISSACCLDSALHADVSHVVKVDLFEFANLLHPLWSLLFCCAKFWSVVLCVGLLTPLSLMSQSFFHFLFWGPLSVSFSSWLSPCSLSLSLSGSWPLGIGMCKAHLARSDFKSKASLLDVAPELLLI